MRDNTQHKLALEEQTVPDVQGEIEEMTGEVALTTSEATADSDTITVEALYGDDAQVAALAERVKMVAPWVHYKLGGQWQQMTKKEVSLVIRRCMALGVDPLNHNALLVSSSFSGGYNGSAQSVTRKHWLPATRRPGPYHDWAFTNWPLTACQDTPTRC